MTTRRRRASQPRVGRPKVPLISREDAIAKALEVIDQGGIAALSIRKLGSELGVNGASLYHHFKDKDDILDGVRRLVLREARVIVTSAKTLSWQDYVTKSVGRYRSALLRHPNVAPLMAPGLMRPLAMTARDSVIAQMVDAGVPIRLAFPILDSAETLAFGSALLNPRSVPPREWYAIETGQRVPHLERALRSTYRSADRMFQAELQALLEGWAALVKRERNVRA